MGRYPTIPYGNSRKRSKLDKELQFSLAAIQRLGGKPSHKAKLRKKAWVRWKTGQALKAKRADQARRRRLGLGRLQEGRLPYNDISELPGIGAARLMGATEDELVRLAAELNGVSRQEQARDRKTIAQRERRARRKHLGMIHMRIGLGLPPPKGSYYLPRVAPVPWSEIALPCQVAAVPWDEIELPSRLA